MTILDGKKLSEKIKLELSVEASNLKNDGIEPALAVILIGDDPASATYVRMKEKSCEKCNIKSIMHRLNENTTEAELLALIDILNHDYSVDGILVQLPLPKHINTNRVLESILPSKDVDGFHAFNVGRLVEDLDGFVPCTPLGVMRLLEEYDINPTGLNACVIGASNIVGKPMFNLLLNVRATISICHSKTKNLSFYTKNADLIIVGVGIPNLLKADMIKKDAIVIDVGINRLANGKLVGDVDFENVAPLCSYITPVPGGVGPMTIAMLLSNTIKSAKIRLNKIGHK